MKKQFRLQGLDCANCAAKIERKIKKIDGVTDACVNFMTQKMEIEGQDDKMEEIIIEATKTANKVLPDMKIRQL